MTALPEALDRATRCVLAFTGQRGPVISPMAFWADGAALWMATPAESVKAAALRDRPECAVHVPAPGGMGDDVMLRGRARIYGLHDPLGLAVHGPLISAAMAALAARNAGTVLGYVQDARHVPQRFRPQNRVVVRVAVEHAAAAPAMQPGPGVAPALPAVVASEVRRAVAGARVVTLAATGADGGIVALPAVWGAGYQIRVADSVPTLPPGPAAVHVGQDPQARPTTVAGLTLTGHLADGVLAVERATWWEGFRLHTVDVPRAGTSSIVLPD